MHLPIPMCRFRRAVAWCLWLAPVASAHAQQARPLRLGERVRVTTETGTIVGVALGVRDDSVSMRVHADSVPRVALADIQRLEASGGPSNRTSIQTSASVVGMLVGGVAGAFIGASLTRSDGLTSSGQYDVPQFFGAVIGGALGVPVGATLGYLSVSSVEPERWDVIPTPTRGVAMVPEPVPDSSSVTPNLAAARAAALPTDTRVRIIRRSDAPDVIGSVVQHGDSLVVRRDDAQLVAVPWSDITRADRSRGLPPAMRAIGLPTALGAISGVLAGLRVVALFVPGCAVQSDCAGNTVAMGVGGVTGAIIGAAVGHGQRKEAWSPVLLPTR